MSQTNGIVIFNASQLPAPKARLELGLGSSQSLQEEEYLQRFAWFRASTAKYTRTALFWPVTPRVVVNSLPTFWTTSDVSGQPTQIVPKGR